MKLRHLIVILLSVTNILFMANQVTDSSCRVYAQSEKTNTDTTAPEQMDATQTAEYFIKRGNIKFSKGDFKGAIKDYNIAIDLKPAAANYYYDRGIARREFGDLNGARKDLLKSKGYYLQEISLQKSKINRKKHITSGSESLLSNSFKPFKIDIEPYMAAVQKKIKANWNNPRFVDTDKAIISFRIAKNGALSNVKLIKSSGYAISDNEAIKAIKQSAPFNPLPENLAVTGIDVQYTFDDGVIGP